MAGYIRADVTDEISNGNTVDAIPLDGEFDALQGAFASVGGHSHSGLIGEGAPILVLGPAQDVVVSANSVTPKTDNTVDLGSTTFEFKDLWIDGVANIDSLVADTADINGGTVDATVIGATTPAAATITALAATTATVGGDTVTTNTAVQTLTNKTVNLTSNTLIATSAQIAAAVTDETGTGALVFAGSPALTGTPTAPTAVAATNTTQIATTAHVFAERANTATLTNKTLTSPVISGGTITGITDLAIADGGTGASTAAGALTNLGLTATAAELNFNSGVTSAVQTQLNNKQPLDADLTAIAGLVSAADTLPYFTGSGTAALATFTAFGRSLVDDADAAAGRATLGLGALATAANVTTAEIAEATLVTASETIASNNNDTTIPTSAAVKAYADAIPVGSMTLLGTLNTTSGTTQTLSGLTLTSYKKLLCVANGVSHDNGAGRNFALAGAAISDVFLASGAVYGDIWIDLTTSRIFGAWTSAGAIIPSNVVQFNTGITTASTSISFTISGSGTFDAGSIRIYGVK